jgi:hypothetical protein
MKKLFSLSIFVFLFMFAFLASTKAFAKDGDNSGSGSSNSGSSDVEDNDDGDDSDDSDESEDGDDSSDDSNDDGDDSDESEDGEENGDDSDDSSDDSNSALEIEADIFTDITVVKIEMNDRKSSFTTDSKTEAEIVADILAKYPNLVQADVEAALNIETEDRDSRPKDTAGEKRSIFSIFNLKKENKEDNSGPGNSEDRPRKLPAESVLNRFVGAVKHIEKFILRLDAAVLQFKTAGSDTAIAEGFLTSAKTDLSEAQTHWQNAKNAYDGGAVGAKEMIKEHLDLMKAEIRSSFENLKATIGALKDLRVGSDDDSDDSDDTDEDNSGTN